MKISASILSGGQNKRMYGLNKAFVEFHNEEMIAKIMKVIRPIFEEIIFVVNHDYSSYSKYCPDKIVSDIIPNRGALSGIHAALNACKNDVCFVFACDMPLINTEIIRRQIDLIEPSYDVIIPKQDNGIEPLHAIYKKSIFSFLDEYLKQTDKNKIELFLDTIQTFYWEIPYNNSFVNINSEIEKVHWENILKKNKQ